MKIPLILSIFILAAGSFWGAQENGKLTVLREKHRKISAEAAALGVSTDLSKPFTPGKASARERGDSNKKVKDFANVLVAFAKEMKEVEKGDKEADPAMQKRIMEMMDGMLSLNGAELKLLIAEMRSRTDMDDEMRKNMIGFSIMMLAQQHPETALAIFTESSDLMKDNPMSNHVLSASLSQWAKDQPLAALEWIKKNAEKHPDLVTDATKRAVIAGAALTDINLAFQLAAELKLDPNDGSLMYQIAQAADTPEKQKEMLAALRKQAAQTTDKAKAKELLQSGVNALFSKISQSGYDKSIEWIAATNLNSDETAKLAESLDYYRTKADTGKWLDWISAQSLEGDDSKNATRNLVRSWTRQDYKAAGEWLSKTPDGPGKETATISYLETVAPYDPEVAAQWAQTLSGDKQKNAMQSIRDQLQQKDKAAAEDFAKRHGLSEQ